MMDAFVVSQQVPRDRTVKRELPPTEGTLRSRTAGRHLRLNIEDDPKTNKAPGERDSIHTHVI